MEKLGCYDRSCELARGARSRSSCRAAKEKCLTWGLAVRVTSTLRFVAGIDVRSTEVSRVLSGNGCGTRVSLRAESSGLAGRAQSLVRKESSARGTRQDGLQRLLLLNAERPKAARHACSSLSRERRWLAQASAAPLLATLRRPPTGGRCGRRRSDLRYPEASMRRGTLGGTRRTSCEWPEGQTAGPCDRARRGRMAGGTERAGPGEGAAFGELGSGLDVINFMVSQT